MKQTKILLSIICSVVIPLSWGCGGQDNPELDSAESAALRLRGPIILSQPADQSVYTGMVATFRVSAIGVGALSYQWLKDGSPIAGAKTSAYAVQAGPASNHGSFSVVVVDLLGRRTTSRGAVLVAKEWSTFTSTGSMGSARNAHTATLLNNGKVLITGGFDGSTYLSTAELYDPAIGTFSTTGSMRTSRSFHTATPLPNGKVLIAGGYPPDPYPAKASGELYDPTTGTFTPAGDMGIEQRYMHSATLLADGRVLVAGGESWHSATSSAELFDPATGAFSGTGGMSIGRWIVHSAVRLLDGDVLVTGGGTGQTAELYRPAIGGFVTTAQMSTPRVGHTTVLLPSGDVLVAGGYDDSLNQHTYLASAERYDPIRGTFTPIGPMGNARAFHTATQLPNGKTLIAGGSSATADVYDPSVGTFAPTATMTAARSLHTATLLPNGKVLVVGGSSPENQHFSSAELYE